MKIVSWNCKVGFNSKKAEYISKFNADLYIIQECTKENVESLKGFWKCSSWYGDNIDSKYGIGVFTSNYDIRLLHTNNPDYRYVVPYRIFTENFNFILFAVWTKDVDKMNKKIEYTEQLWQAINYKYYQSYLNNSVLLIGDFNSNNYWEKEYKRKKVHSHNDIIEKLKELKIESCYHKYNKCENGKEEHPTLLWQNKETQKFHIDYCFASSDFMIENFEIVSIDEWKETNLSDHCPIIIELRKT